MQAEQTARKLITVAQMRAAEQRAMAAGTSGAVLMERAGRAVADAICRATPAAGRVAVLCGPGNNGGDGYVIARVLQGRGFDVTVYGLVPTDVLAGDARAMAERWEGPVHPPQRFIEDKTTPAVIVDALFGTGLGRAVAGQAGAMLDKANRCEGVDLRVAVDIPSGIDGDTGAINGVVFRADRTVTFHAMKPGHLLQWGAEHAGTVEVADIGLGADATDFAIRATDGPDFIRNDAAPILFGMVRDPYGNKFTNGHALVIGGGLEGAGACRLAARGALRAGAGLVTLGVPGSALLAHAARGPDALMPRRCDGVAGLEALLADKRRNAVVIGPAFGIGAETREAVATVLKSGRACVLDADALTSFAGHDAELAALTNANGRAVLTPHMGEFTRLFPDLTGLMRVNRAIAAAARLSAIVILKGRDTIIAAPDGRVAINTNAPAWLGTAGSGDVLAGLIGGLLAQGLAPFCAARAAVWLHGEAGQVAGRGLIADDLPEAVHQVLRSMV